jgi:hypothetical protein
MSRNASVFSLSKIFIDGISPGAIVRNMQGTTALGITDP